MHFYTVQFLKHSVRTTLVKVGLLFPLQLHISGKFRAFPHVYMLSPRTDQTGINGWTRLVIFYYYIHVDLNSMYALSTSHLSPIENHQLTLSVHVGLVLSCWLSLNLWPTRSNVRADMMLCSSSVIFTSTSAWWSTMLGLVTELLFTTHSRILPHTVQQLGYNPIILVFK